MQTQCDLGSVCSISKSWNSKLNIDKCFVIRFGGNVNTRLTDKYHIDVCL